MGSTRVTIVWLGGKRRKDINTVRRGSGASAGAGSGARLRDGSRKVAQWAAAAITSEVFKKSGSGARALRKYACDANAIWDELCM
eukprot:6194391-Pleurochrysis_carterae.AAC.2